jgi:site-specific DNA-adenine methylase
MALIRIKDLEEMVSKYKTISAKKSFLTKEIKALKEHHNELKEAYEKRRKGNGYGWYLGDKIHLLDVKNAERDIFIVERFKKENYE